MKHNHRNLLAALLVSFAVMLLPGCSDKHKIVSVEEAGTTSAPAHTSSNVAASDFQTSQSGEGQSNTLGERTRNADPSKAIEREKNTIVVITEASYAPYEFIDDKGNMVGFDIDLINAIAKDQGYKAHIISYPFSKLFEMIQYEPNVDLIVACISKTEDRAKKALLSDSYLDVGTAFAVRTDDIGIKSAKDLKGKTISFIDDSIFKEDFDKVLGGDYKPSPAKSHYLAIREVILGKADAVAADSGVLSYNLNKYAVRNLKVIRDEINLPFHETVIAVNKNRPELLAQVNEGLKNIKASGEYQRIYNKWLKTVID